MAETQASIAQWALETFGPAPNTMRMAARINEEMAELLRAAASEVPPSAVLAECADVVIVMCRLVESLGGDLWGAVEDKMAINRARQWRVDGTGHGYHIRNESAAHGDRHRHDRRDELGYWSVG